MKKRSLLLVSSLAMALIGARADAFTLKVKYIQGFPVHIEAGDVEAKGAADSIEKDEKNETFTLKISKAKVRAAASSADLKFYLERDAGYLFPGKKIRSVLNEATNELGKEAAESLCARLAGKVQDENEKEYAPPCHDESCKQGQVEVSDLKLGKGSCDSDVEYAIHSTCERPVSFTCVYNYKRLPGTYEAEQRSKVKVQQDARAKDLAPQECGTDELIEKERMERQLGEPGSSGAEQKATWLLNLIVPSANAEARFSIEDRIKNCEFMNRGNTHGNFSKMQLVLRKREPGVTFTEVLRDSKGRLWVSKIAKAPGYVDSFSHHNSVGLGTRGQVLVESACAQKDRDLAFLDRKFSLPTLNEFKEGEMEDVTAGLGYNYTYWTSDVDPANRENALAITITNKLHELKVTSIPRSANLSVACISR